MKCYYCKKTIKPAISHDGLDKIVCDYCQQTIYLLTCTTCQKQYYLKDIPSKKQVICKACQTVIHIVSKCDEPRAVFISYAHEDEAWKDELLKYLNVYKDDGVTVWTDRELCAGDQWNAEIEKAIDHAKIAILLISIDFLNSSFIMDNEVPLILENQQLRIIPIIVSACPWQKKEWIKQTQVRPKEAKPLTQFDPKTELPSELTQLAEEVSQLCAEQVQLLTTSVISKRNPHLMCNRIPHVKTFRDNYTHQKNMGPQFYFIHGMEGDKHHSLVKRLTETIITQTIKNKCDTTFNPLILKYRFKEGNYSKHHQQAMIYDLGFVLSDGDDNHQVTSFETLMTLEQFQPYENNAIIISHHVPVQLFQSDLITWYITQFWRQGFDSYVQANTNQSIPQFILFFNIIYDEPSGLFQWRNPKKRIQKYLNGLIQVDHTSCQKHCVSIDELTPVNKNHVKEWFSIYKKQLPDTMRDQLIDNIFINKTKQQSMKKVEEHLEKICK